MRPTGKVAALILAAGSSSRMGSPKALLQFGRSSALEEAVNRFREAGISDVRVVVGHGAEGIILLVERLKAQWIFNKSYQEGMLSSILAGTKSFERDIEAFFLLPVDTPLVKPRTIRECLQEYRQGEASVIYPCFLGIRGHPPLIATACVSELRGDHQGGLRAFLKRYQAEAREVAVVDQGITMGCNTPEEYQGVLAYESREDVPTERECEALWDRFGVPGGVITHCRMVSELARVLAVHLNYAGFHYDIDLIVAAGCLHDLAKGQPDHARKGANILRNLGYERVAELVASHMEIDFRGCMGESELIYLADKCVDGNRLVRLEERLERAIERFSGNPDALTASVKRLKTAQAIRERFEALTGITLEGIICKYHGYAF